jgi:isopenicillin N synthase-like dioxygenase
MENIPTIDLDNYTYGSILKSFHETGILIVKVSDKTTKVNSDFIDLMERYSKLPEETRMKHVHKEAHYQVGLTPSFTEMPRDNCDVAITLGAIKPKARDPKMRWFHRTTPVEENTEFTDVTGQNVIPDEFPEWSERFNDLGDVFMDVLFKVNEKLSLEIGTDLNELVNGGNHLIAPTIMPLENIIGTENKIVAGIHNDISYQTFHGRGRFTGLNIWTRDGTKIAIKVPENCILIQAGRQLQYITNGYILGGFHEVIITEETEKQYYKALHEGRSTTRISSTFFSHINSDKVMQVLPQFYTEGCEEKYPPIKEGAWLRSMLRSSLKF